MFIIYRYPNCETYLNKIWHWGSPWGGMFLGGLPHSSTPRAPGPKRKSSGVLESQSCILAKTLKNKIGRVPPILGSPFGPPNLEREEPVSLWSHDHSFWRRVYNTKVVGHLPLASCQLFRPLSLNQFLFWIWIFI